MAETIQKTAGGEILAPDKSTSIGEKGMAQFSGRSHVQLSEDGRDFLKMLEKRPGLKATTPVSQIREAVGSDAFDSLTLDRIYKSMLKGYETYEPNWEKVISKRTPVSDFHTHYGVIHSGFDRLAQVGEKESYPEMEFSDDTISWTPAKYGGLFGYSFEASTYDSLGLLDDVSAKLGAAARRTLDYYFFYTLLDANPTSYDGSNAIFGNHGSTAGTFANTMTTNGLTMALLETAYTTMLQQTQLDSSSTFTDTNYMPAMYIPKYLVVHPANSLLAKRLLKSANYPGNANNDVNVLNGELELIVTPFITSTHWYMIADPATANTFEAGLWGGNAAPELFYEPANTGHNFAFDEIRTKIRTIFGGNVLDPRAFIHGATA